MMRPDIDSNESQPAGRFSGEGPVQTTAPTTVPIGWPFGIAFDTDESLSSPISRI
jgi:hypothetical protein